MILPWSPKSALKEIQAQGLGLVKERALGLPGFKSSPRSGKTQSLLGQGPLLPLLPGFRGPGLLPEDLMLSHHHPAANIFTQTRVTFQKKYGLLIS